MPSVMLSIRFVFEMKFYRTSARISSMVIRSWACHLSTTISSYRFKALTTAHIVRIDTEWWTNIDQGSKWTEARFSGQGKFLGRFNEGRQKYVIPGTLLGFTSIRNSAGMRASMMTHLVAMLEQESSLYLIVSLIYLVTACLLRVIGQSPWSRQTRSKIFLLFFSIEREREKEKKCEKKPSKPSTFHR